jgi:dinuclear metal center YbgI/SA1388 family protein
MMSRATAVNVGDLSAAMERIAPTRLAADWDNVGLLAGDVAWPCRRVLVAVDLTPDVLNEAVSMRADAIVAYHPPVFRPITRMSVTRGTTEGLAAEALSRRIGIYSPHTALDAAPGGTNDVLAELCGVRETRPFVASPAAARECKVVVFVPPAKTDAVAEAMFAAGAGRIGEYTHCSFRIPGQGTFFGTEETSPTVGRRGRLERVEEIRLEAIAPQSAIPQVVAAIRRSHPYEEPAFDIYPLAPTPSKNHGQGRIGDLPRPTPLASLAKQLMRRMAAQSRGHATPTNIACIGRRDQRIRRALICVGAAGSLPFEIDDPAGCGVGDVIVTGEIRHHDALRYLRCGAAAIALGHWTSERPGVAVLAKRLKTELRGVDVRLSRRDRDPFMRG